MKPIPYTGMWQGTNGIAPVISKYNFDLIQIMLHDPEFDPMPFIAEALTHLLDSASDKHPLRIVVDEYKKKHEIKGIESPRFLPGIYKP